MKTANEAYTELLRKRGPYVWTGNCFDIFNEGWKAKEKDIADQEMKEIDIRMEQTFNSMESDIVKSCRNINNSMNKIQAILAEHDGEFKHAECQGCHRAVVKANAKHTPDGYFCDDCFETHNPKTGEKGHENRTN